MGLEVGIAELVEGGVGVDLGGGEVGVTEEGLDGVDVGAVVEELHGERVAEDVG